MNEKTLPMSHPIDEPCPPGCPTRNAEIASAVTGWVQAYAPITLTAEDVAAALAKPRDAYGPSDLERRIHDVAATWQ